MQAGQRVHPQGDAVAGGQPGGREFPMEGWPSTRARTDDFGYGVLARTPQRRVGLPQQHPEMEWAEMKCMLRRCRGSTVS